MGCYQGFSKDELKNEVWKDIPGYENLYQISDLGRVKSLYRIVSHSTSGYLRLKERILSVGKDDINRLSVNLCKNGQAKVFRVHCLVMMVFVGQRPKNYDVCHNDGDPTNNRLSNLRYDTRKNNEKDKIKHGTLCNGEKHPNSKLKKDDVLEIRRLYSRGVLSQYEIAKIYGLHQVTVSQIILYKRWKHI